MRLVFVATYRGLVFMKEILEDLRTIFSNVCQDFEATLEEFDGEHDHVQWLITYPPKAAISRRINSSHPDGSVRSTISRIERALWDGSLWSPSYFGPREEPQA